MLETASFLPHGFCLLWRPNLVALHVVSDLSIGLAYFSIPLASLIPPDRRPDLATVAGWRYLFAAFIVLCGTTHAQGRHALAALTTALTRHDKSWSPASCLVTTAALLWPLLSKIVALPSPQRCGKPIADLEAEDAGRRAAEVQLRQGSRRSRASSRRADRCPIMPCGRRLPRRREGGPAQGRSGKPRKTSACWAQNVRDYAITWYDTQGRTTTGDAERDVSTAGSAAEAVGQGPSTSRGPEAADEAERRCRGSAGNRPTPAVEGAGGSAGTAAGSGSTRRITPLWDDEGRMRGYVRMAPGASGNGSGPRRNSAGARMRPSRTNAPSPSSWRA